MITLVSAGALAGGITLAVVDMILDARRERAVKQARQEHPAGSRVRG